MDLNEYWNKIQQGDEKALEALFKYLNGPLYRYAFYLTEDDFLAEEIVMDVFLKLWQKKDRIKLKSSVKPYLYRCVYNHAINSLLSLNKQKSGTNNLISGSTWDELMDRIGSDENIIEKIEAKETEISLLKIIETLPEQCREIFKLSRLEYKSNKEIAIHFKISENTVKVQIFRALNKIKEKFFPKK